MALGVRGAGLNDGIIGRLRSFVKVRVKIRDANHAFELTFRLVDFIVLGGGQPAALGMVP